MKYVLIPLLFLLASCSDPLGFNHPVNKQLDAEILDRIKKLKARQHALKITFDFEQADRTLKTIVNAINMMDASTRRAIQADNCFRAYASALSIPSGTFIKLESLTDKPSTITAIKTNELILLDRLLFIK